jgi:hypothetical protein
MASGNYTSTMTLIHLQWYLYIYNDSSFSAVFHAGGGI